ncbi:MAG: hypothetical protein RI995_338 [Bacteroidota bacterium]|jgi:hypothetical protein
MFCQCVGQDIFTPLKDKKQVTSYSIKSHLKVDGHLDEPEWNLAKPIYLDFQVEPFQGKLASFKTSIRLLSNQHFLYVAAINYDTIGKNKFRAPNLKRDYAYSENDLLGIAIDAFNDHRNAIVFQSNAYGVQRDLLSFDDMYYDVDWDGLYRVRTHQSDTAWVAEFAIPWQTLRYPNVKSREAQDWGINFFRVRRTSNELSVWSPHPRAFSTLRMEYAGQLKGILPPAPSITNIRFVPYVLFSDIDKQGSEVGFEKRNQLKVGGEIKWAINNNNILDVTFHTDFAQADVDRQVNNISRFSVFFPERRQFFLENASLFSSGLAPTDEVLGGSMYIKPFFSRTIGLDKDVNPVPIVAGARYVYRSDRNNVGAILMQQGAGDGFDYTNFGVGRLSHNFGKQNRLGFIATTKQNPTFNDNTFAVDGFVRFSEKMYYSGMISNSSNGKDHLQGWAQFNQLMYRTNQIAAYWTQTYVDQYFQPSMGFVSRSNVLSNSQGINYNIRKSWYPKWLRSLEPGIYTELYHSLTSKNLIERTILFTPGWTTLQNGGVIGMYGLFNYQRLESDFAPLNIKIALGEYHFFRKGFYFSTDQSKKYSTFITADFGDFFNGKQNIYSIKTNVAPIPHVNVGFTLNRNEIRDLGVAKESKDVNLWMIESRLAINPRIQLIGFYQQNSLNDLHVVNLRFSWEYQPLSYVYLVFNQMEHIGDDLTLQKQKAFLAKVSFLKQF